MSVGNNHEVARRRGRRSKAETGLACAAVFVGAVRLTESGCRTASDGSTEAIHVAEYASESPGQAAERCQETPFRCSSSARLT